MNNTKEYLVSLYSDIPTVIYKTKQLMNIINSDFELKISDNPNKKFSIKGKFTNYKWVDFGEMGYQDYTKHNDDKRRELFQKRNHKWSKNAYNTPGFLSYYILW